jgi:dihydroorotate dehydrogenase (NAD+) catalytic subunit
MLASGILGVTMPVMARMVEAGAGAVVSKSISLEPREGYTNPTIVGVEGGYVNAIGLANPGIEAFLEELEAFPQDLPLVVNIVATSPQEFRALAERLKGPKVKGIELNLSCPHVKGTGIEVGDDPELVAEIVREVKAAADKPVYPKLSGHIPRLTEVAWAAVDAGADGIVAINTLRAMAIDIWAEKPVLSNRIGGLSGAALKPVAVRCVYELYEAVDVPIIGVGGIAGWEDAVEFFLAGASAVQIGSALAVKGYGLFAEVVEGLRSYLERKGYGRLEELVGRAHQ